MLHCFGFVTMTKPFDGTRMQVAVNIEVPTLQLALMKRNMGQDKVLHFDDASDSVEILQIVLRVAPVIVPQDERLLSVETRGDLKPSLAETEIPQVPDGVFLSYRGIPAADKLLVVFLKTCEFPSSLFVPDFDDPFVVEMRIGDEEDFAHIHQYGVS